MNERIRELASCNERVQNFFETGPVQRAAIEQFAELIVRECGVALSPMLRDMMSRGQAYDMIKEHFGIES
jgi:hypothetical protein